MRTVDPNTIKDALMDTCGPGTSPRTRLVLERLVHHLHAFAKEVDLSHEEWRLGIDLLTRAGEITDRERNEFVLFSDVLGLSSLVDMLHSPKDATPSSVLGPFHILGAPEIPSGGDLIGDNEGDHVAVIGAVRSTDGSPVAGAVMEIWQTAANGLYSNQDTDQPEYNLRARLKVGEDGRFCFTTVRPAPYTVPTDGPVGTVLGAMDRHPWRPSHLHLIVEAPGHRSLVTELFPSDDPYLDEDAVYGVREALVTEYVPRTSTEDLPAELEARERLALPYFRVDFDISLARETADQPREASRI